MKIDVSAMLRDPEFRKLTSVERREHVREANALNAEHQATMEELLARPQPATMDELLATQDTGSGSLVHAFPGGGGPGPDTLAPIGDIPRGIKSVFIGDTPTQQGITGGMLGADALSLAGRLPGAWGTAARLAAPVIGGLAGGAIEGGAEGATQGAVLGTAMGVPANVASYLINKPYGRLAEQSGLADLLTKHFPSLGALGEVITNKVSRLQALLVGGAGEKLVGRRLTKIKSAIQDQVAGPMSFQTIFPTDALPEIKKLPYTFDAADKEITNLLDRSYVSATGDPRTTVTGDQMRQWAHSATERLAAEIGRTDPALAREYLAARREFAHMREMKHMVGSAPGAISKNRLNLDVIQQKIGTDPGLFERLRGSHFGQDVMDWAFRGAPPTAVDVPGQLGIGLSLRPEMGGPHVWAHPQLHRTVGSRPEIPMLRTAALAGERGAMQVLSAEKAEAQQTLTDAVKSGQTPPLGALRKLATDPDAGLTSVQRRRLLGILPPAPLPAAPAVR